MQRENEKEKTVVMSVFGVRVVLVSVACTFNRIQKLHQMQLELEPGVSPASLLKQFARNCFTERFADHTSILMGRL